MAYNIQLADRVREYLAAFPKLEIEEKKMFSGLAFLVNGKMCINIGSQNLICRFETSLTNELDKKTSFLTMIMKDKELKGYCYVEATAIKRKKDFEYWINLCLDFNEKAKASKKLKKQ